MVFAMSCCAQTSAHALGVQSRDIFNLLRLGVIVQASANNARRSYPMSSHLSSAYVPPMLFDKESRIGERKFILDRRSRYTVLGNY
jgi:hypothetical protein